ncbi:MAG: type I secretion system permease/ATPase [Pseudomonadota bacterium]
MKNDHGPGELRRAMGTCRQHFAWVAVFSIFVNLLMLTGPLFMLQVYDRVLASRSVPTLVALVLLVSFLYLMMGILEWTRGRMLARAGARFQDMMESRVFTATMKVALSPAARARPNNAARNLDSIKQLLSGPAPFAVFDIPWTPLFLAIIFLFHPLMGWLAIGGGVVMVALTALNQIRSRRLTLEAAGATNEADNLGEAMRQNAEAVQGLGMRDAAMARWRQLRERALHQGIHASDRSGSYASASKAMRMYMQSLMLALGAWLVLQQQISPGMMIAASILMTRALAPIDQAIGQWSLVQRAFAGWRDLGSYLAEIPNDIERTRLPDPKGILEVQKIGVRSPDGEGVALRDVSFVLRPGQALGVIGPSGAGKTTLAKVLTGIWAPTVGKVRLDGAALDHWPIEDLGRHFGYLPQDGGLFSGTVAQNIARMSAEPDAEKVVEAARRAQAHEMLLTLPQGYDTDIGSNGGRLSGGQRQRVALARALYGDPPVLVLDEPNANLDAQGEQAVIEAIRDAKERGRTVIVIAHRPSAIAACDMLLMLDKGQQVEFGPRDEVLKKRTRNYTQLVAKTGGQQPDGQRAQAPVGPGAPVGAPPPVPEPAGALAATAATAADRAAPEPASVAVGAGAGGGLAASTPLRLDEAMRVDDRRQKEEG